MAMDPILMSTATDVVSNGTMIMFKGNDSTANSGGCAETTSCIGWCIRDNGNDVENGFCLAISRAADAAVTNGVAAPLSFGCLLTKGETEVGDTTIMAA